MDKKPIKELRVWEENGKVHTREIINESIDTIDRTPHPTECRLLFLDDDVETIYSQEIDETDIVPHELGLQLTLIEMKYIYDLDNGNL